MLRSTLLACATVTAFFAFTATADADSQHDNVRSQRVAYADLDLDNETDADELLRRIERAAARVCGDRPGVMPPSERREIRRCMTDAMGRTVAMINRPVLNARYSDSRSLAGAP